MMSAEIENLGDDLLAEILHRLTYKDSRRCLSVCKAWSLLVSQTSFLKKLMAFHRPNNQLHQQPYVILNLADDQNRIGDARRGGRQDHHDAKALDRSLDFLPKREGKVVQVLRVSLDLFLCGHLNKSFGPNKWARRSAGSTYDFYYVCNILTRQWTALPPRPHDCPKNLQFCSSRFYNEDPDNDGIYNPEYEYIVLVVDGGMKENYCGIVSSLKFELFSSKDKVWKTLTLSVPRGFYFLDGSWLHESCFDAGILWYSNKRCIIRCNVNDLAEEPSLIALPPPPPHHSIYSSRATRIGVCNGRLRLAELHTIRDDNEEFDVMSQVIVWELQGGGKWHLMHEIPIQDVCFHPNTFNNLNIVGAHIFIRNVRFHPNDPDIVLVKQNECIAEWNARTKDFRHYEQAATHTGRMFLTLPWYPTPVLPLKNMYKKNWFLDPPMQPVVSSTWTQVDLFSALRKNLPFV